MCLKIEDQSAKIQIARSINEPLTILSTHIKEGDCCFAQLCSTFCFCAFDFNDNVNIARYSLQHEIRR